MHMIDTEGDSLAEMIATIAPVLEEQFGSGGKNTDD
jgi:hypothetical protein